MQPYRRNRSAGLRAVSQILVSTDFGATDLHEVFLEDLLLGCIVICTLVAPVHQALQRQEDSFGPHICRLSSAASYEFQIFVAR